MLDYHIWSHCLVSNTLMLKNGAEVEKIETGYVWILYSHRPFNYKDKNL